MEFPPTPLPQGPASPGAAELRPGPGPAPSARRAGPGATSATASLFPTFPPTRPLPPFPARPPTPLSFPHRRRSLTPLPVPARRPLTVTARRGGSGNARAARARPEARGGRREGGTS